MLGVKATICKAKDFACKAMNNLTSKEKANDFLLMHNVRLTYNRKSLNCCLA